VVYTVTAEDGTTAQYTVTVTIAANTDASLTALSVNPGSIAFDPETLTYDNVVVPYGTTEVTVTFTAAPQATTSVSSPQTVSIVGKTGTFSVEVTAGDGVAKNTYTINFIEALNPAKEITSFSFAAPAATGVINEADKKIAVTVPFGTDVTNLTPTIVHTGASITPASGTPQDFTNPVVYTVTAEDGTTAQYTVTVTIAANTDASLTALSVNPGSIAFDPETLTYDNVVVPYGTTEVTVTFTAAPQATTSVSSPQTVSIVGKTGTFSVEVTAGDGVAKNTYTINFIEALNPAKEITSFSFAAPAATGVINEADKKIAVTVPFGTDVTNLTPTIVHTGASIVPASGTPQDFTNPVVYTVTAEDGTTAQYTVTVTIAANTDASLTALSVNPGSIAFDPETLTYDNVVVPYGTTEVTVTFTAAPQATTSVSSPQTVNIVGKTGTFSVEVTAGDGVAKNTYTINFIEALNPARKSRASALLRLPPPE
jgi:flagellar hook assembly protein FlgD